MAYKPWLTAQDLSRAKSTPGKRSSEGTLVRPQGRVVQREYHLASGLESQVFHFWDNLDLTSWGLQVFDLLEQFPLLAAEGAAEEPARDTIAIARELGVPHTPADRPDSPTVMTTDLVVRGKAAHGQPFVTVLAVKRADAFDDPKRRGRILEKLEVEMVYWKRHTFDGLPVQWYLVTEEQVPDTLLSNLRHVGGFRSPERLNLPSPADLAIIRRICLESVDAALPLSRLTRQLDQQLHLSLGTSIKAVYHLIACRELEVDLNEPLRPERPLAFGTSRR